MATARTTPAAAPVEDPFTRTAEELREEVIKECKARLDGVDVTYIVFDKQTWGLIIMCVYGLLIGYFLFSPRH